MQVYLPAARCDTVYMYMSTYLQYRKKFKSGSKSSEHVLTDDAIEPSMLVQQRNSLQQLQDDQRCWESESILAGLKGQARLHTYKQITTLISLMEAEKTAKARETYQDRGSAHFSTTYSNEQSLVLAKTGLFRGIDMPFARDVQRQAIEHHLDTVVSEKNCGRSELIRDAQLPDLFLSTPPDGWVKQGHTFQADVIAKDQGKTNKDGKHEFHGCFRDRKHLASDARTAISLQLYQLLEIEGYKQQLIDDFEPRLVANDNGVTTKRPWMDWFLMPGFTRNKRRDLTKPTSSLTQRNHFNKALVCAGIDKKKGQSTHLRRHHALKTHARGASRQARARYGGWAEGTGRLERHYEDPLEWGVMAAASGANSEASAILFDQFSDAMDLVQAVKDAGTCARTRAKSGLETSQDVLRCTHSLCMRTRAKSGLETSQDVLRCTQSHICVCHPLFRSCTALHVHWFT